MLLKVGELAKRSGMSVRMLHHYDAIGLLRPSTRSDGDHRLYNPDDIARLHAIQALRQIGLPLKEIDGLLKGEPEPMPAVIQRQITALEYQIEQAQELCGRLKLLKSGFSEGNSPDLASWLSMLSSMSTFGNYFTAAELKKIFNGGKATEHLWAPLVADIHAVMQSAISPTSLEIQALARRWMDLSVRMTQGDFELMKRWEKMYLQEPSARGKRGDNLELVEYINKAVNLRVEAFLRHFSQCELQSFNVNLDAEWTRLATELHDLDKKKLPTSNRELQAAVRKWHKLVSLTCNNNAQMTQKYIHAFGTDPVLHAGTILGPRLEGFIYRAWKADAKQ